MTPEGFEPQLVEELQLAGVRVERQHGRLLVCDGPSIDAAWAANTWCDVEQIGIDSIGHAARTLRERQRNWALYAPQLRGRAQLIHRCQG